jgi:hypothetical protein
MTNFTTTTTTTATALPANIVAQRDALLKLRAALVEAEDAIEGYWGDGYSPDDEDLRTPPYGWMRRALLAGVEGVLADPKNYGPVALD